MARLRQDTTENDGGYENTLTTNARRRPLRSRASSTSSESDIDPLEQCRLPRTPTNGSQKNQQVRLININSLKRFAQSPTRPLNEIAADGTTVRTPHIASSLRRTLISQRHPDKTYAQDFVSSGGENSLDAARFRSRSGPGGSDTVPPASGTVHLSQTVPSRIAGPGLSQSLLELSDSLRALRVIDDNQGQWDKASVQGTLSDKENHDAVIRFSPTRSKSPAKDTIKDRPVTPSLTSPTRSRLQSPTKRALRLPTPPGRPSLDTFWDAQDVNSWSDRHSPQKPLRSPRKPVALQGGLPPVSPKKADQADRAARKLFATTKHALGTAFLAELDQKITAGRIQTLSASTGGVQLIWSATLSTTAGRASWRHETPRTRRSPSSGPSPTAPTTVPSALPTVQEGRHFATIELATKIIDSPVRLYNTLAHEFCHLANFMISGVKDQPHGKSFRAWGRRVSAAFADRGVEVTTKHTFEIEYRYMWRCGGVDKERKRDDGDDIENANDEEDGPGHDGCGTEYQRHSKSIDPRRQRCGSCKGVLVQVRPVPRRGEKAGEVKGYAAFVKANFKAVKADLPTGSSHKVVMETLGAKYRAEREGQATGDGSEVDLRPPILEVATGEEVGAVQGTRGRTKGSGLDEIVSALEVVVLSDDDRDGDAA